MKRLWFMMLLLVVATAPGCSDEREEIIIGNDNGNGEEPPPPPPVVIRVPQDKPTIQAAVDSAVAGDTVLVAAGQYRGDGNHDITFGGKSVVVISEDGPAFTIIDCEGSDTDLRGGFHITQAGDSAVVIDGFTITGGYASQGSAINFRTASATIRNCVIAGNYGMISGGAIRCKGASPTFENCTFVDNGAPAGATAYLLNASSPHFENCIIAFSAGGEVIDCSDDLSEPTLACSDVFGNEGGDWIGCLADLAGTLGNISSDPMFCDTAAANFHVMPGSPCEPANNSCNELVGALTSGCTQ